jgi:hypothetical protein
VEAHPRARLYFFGHLFINISWRQYLYDISAGEIPWPWR